MTPGIWLEISNVRVSNSNSGELSVQLRADREPDQPPRWWLVATGAAVPEQFKRIAEALEKKRQVLARLTCGDKGMVVSDVAIQYAETTK